MSTNSSMSYSFLQDTQSCCGNVTGCSSADYLFNGTRLLLLVPSSVVILYLGFRQWRPQRSFKAASHSDILTYHLALLELVWALGAVLFYVGLYCDHLSSQIVGYYLKYIIFFGETEFHVLTCVDRYLAVVQAVTYRQLRGRRGAIIRNIGISAAWLFSFLWSFFAKIVNQTLPVIPFFCFLFSSFAVVCFCSISVLCALFRPKPGTNNVDKQQIDHTKQRAFFTVMAITGVLCFWILGFSVANILREFRLLGDSVSCMVRKSVLCFSLPSSLVLPALYLHKVGKLPCCHKRG